MVKEKGIYYDGYLKSNLEMMKDALKKDWDATLIVSGMEGGGKSCLSMQICKFLDPTFNNDSIAFNAKEFKEKVMKAGKYSAVLFDEAYQGLNSRQACSQSNKTINSMLSEVRQKNLYLVIVLPSFFELDRYPAIHRSRALIHVYAKGLQRGYFSFFNYDKKKTLYVTGKKFYQFRVQPNFRGRFTAKYAVDEKEYKKRKLKALNYKEPVLENPLALQRDSLIKFLTDEKYSQKEIAKAVCKHSDSNFTRSGVSKALKRLEGRNEKTKRVLV